MPDLDRYVVVGNPVEHSLSPRIHAAFARETGEHLQYEKELVPIGGFAAFVDEFIATGGRGLNVTVPFKPDAYAYVGEHDELAAIARAVNTISVTDDGVKGFNTDGIGLVQDLTERLDVDLRDSRILILGAGGATRGILKSLIDARPRSIVIANRTASKAADLAQAFGAQFPVDHCALDDVNEPADVVLNSTSAGLDGDHVKLPPPVIEGAFCYDLAYGPAALFSAWASENGAGGASDGLGMLIGQAAESFAIWRGVRPATEDIYATLRKEIDGG